MNRFSGSETSLLKDSQWSVIDGEFCRVLDFIPLGLIRNGKVLNSDKSTPYASVTFECVKLPTRTTGFISHSVDFMNLWRAFKERTIQQNEEVIISWTRKHYKYKFLQYVSLFMPKLWVMICPRGAYELHTNPGYKPELKGEARWLASAPIVEWKPPLMA